MADPTIKRIDQHPNLSGLAAIDDKLLGIDVSQTDPANKTVLIAMEQLTIHNANQLKADVVESTKIKDGAVLTDKLAAGAVTPLKLDGISGLPTADRFIFYDQSTGKFGVLNWPALTIEETAVVDKAAVSLPIAGELEPLEVGQKKFLWTVPHALAGYSVKGVVINILAPSTSGIPTFDIRRGRRSSPTAGLTFLSMFSTKPTIDVGEYSSANATNGYVANTNILLAGDDVLSIDISVAGTSTKGLTVNLELWK